MFLKWTVKVCDDGYSVLIGICLLFCFFYLSTTVICHCCSQVLLSMQIRSSFSECSTVSINHLMILSFVSVSASQMGVCLELQRFIFAVCTFRMQEKQCFLPSDLHR